MMVKQTIVYLNHGILISTKKEETADTIIINEFQGNYAEWKKKLIANDYIPYDSIYIYITFMKWQNYRGE